MVTLMAKKKSENLSPEGEGRQAVAPSRKKVSFCAEGKSEEQYIKALI